MKENEYFPITRGMTLCWNTAKLPDDPPVVCLGQITGITLEGAENRTQKRFLSQFHSKPQSSKTWGKQKYQITGIFSSYFLTSFRKPVTVLYLKTVL